MTAERSTVQYGSRRIDYGILRSRRVKTVAVAVDPTEGVVVTAPGNVAVERLDGIVKSKAAWIVGKLKRNSELPPPPPRRQFVSGETFRYLGRQYRLKVAKKTRPSDDVALVRGWLTVEVLHSATDAERIARVRPLVVRWYREHAGARLPERVALWARKVGVPAPEVLVREQQKRWGSCDAKGRLRFNWLIIQAPMRLVDYVVAHELVHLLHPNHDNAFWATLGKVMPDYEERRQALREFGSGVEW
ncbi:MAG: SprT family zinc-dependent metalloprotease [Polyangia bacterium]